jgi:hypothetical protein
MQATSCIGRNSARNLALAMLAAGLAVSVAALPLSAAEKSGGLAKAAKGSRGLGTQVAHLVPQNHDFETYLDRLMMAESSGRDFLQNSRSSALGPFQFIKGTFLYVTRRHFQSELAGKSLAEILALRTNRAFSRKVIAVYTKELAQHLDRHDLPTTYGNLRLAYLLGPSGATKVLKAEPDRSNSTPDLQSSRCGQSVSRSNDSAGPDRPGSTGYLDGSFKAAQG